MCLKWLKPLSNRRGLLWAAAFLLLIRIASLPLYPLGDTTEARYGQIARLMLVSGDWMIPQHGPAEPFLAKPPLSFWAQAVSMQFFGINELGARISSVLFALLTAGLLYHLATRDRTPDSMYVAAFMLAILGTMPLFFVLAGAVMTDMALVACTTACMVAFWHANLSRRYWGFLFFAALGLGMLAKGPIAVVTVSASLLLYVLWGSNRKQRWTLAYQSLPWTLGTCIFLILALPWYVWAELHQPGFVEYFFWGEHVQRFLQPDWSGDRYGTAHRTAVGAVWGYFLLSTLTWWPFFILYWVQHYRAERATIQSSLQRIRAYCLPAAPRDAFDRYLLSWILATLLFFTFSSNTIWSYVLPSIPPAALYLARRTGRSYLQHRLSIALTVLITIVILATIFLVVVPSPNISKQRSTKHMVHAAQVLQHWQPNTPIVSIRKQPYSLRFYGRDQIPMISYQETFDLLAQKVPVLFIVSPEQLDSSVVGPLATALQDGTVTVGQFGAFQLRYQPPSK